MNSEKKEINGGTPKLLTLTIKINRWRDKDTCERPEILSNWRDCVKWNIKPLTQNIIEEVSAWDNITSTPNTLDSTGFKESTTNEKFMWHTDLKATNLLISLWWKDKTDPKTIPRTPSTSTNSCWMYKDNRKSPQHPNFKRRPAKRIDPTVGASTWALGSQ